MVESEDNTDGSDYYEIIEGLRNPHTMVRMFALGKMKRTLDDFSK